MALEHGEVTEQIIGAAFEVYSILGDGFLEKVYQRAMQVERLPIGGPTSHDHWRVSIRVQSVYNPWPRLEFLTGIAQTDATNGPLLGGKGGILHGTATARQGGLTAATG
jgi:hypothetical protein